MSPLLESGRVCKCFHHGQTIKTRIQRPCLSLGSCTLFPLQMLSLILLRTQTCQEKPMSTEWGQQFQLNPAFKSSQIGCRYVREVFRWYQPAAIPACSARAPVAVEQQRGIPTKCRPNPTHRTGEHNKKGCCFTPLSSEWFVIQHGDLEWQAFKMSLPFLVVQIMSYSYLIYYELRSPKECQRHGNKKIKMIKRFLGVGLGVEEEHVTYPQMLIHISWLLWYAKVITNMWTLQRTFRCI